MVDGGGSEAQFQAMTGVAADDKSNLYVADTNNSAVRFVVWNGDQNIPSVYGRPTVVTLSTAFRNPTGVAVGPAGGGAYVTDTGNHQVRLASLSLASLLSPKTGGEGLDCFLFTLWVDTTGGWERGGAAQAVGGVRVWGHCLEQQSGGGGQCSRPGACRGCGRGGFIAQIRVAYRV